MPDLSKDTVTPDKLVLGETAHDASGTQITGTLDTNAIRAEGVEAGKIDKQQELYNRIMDSIQDKGERTEYRYFFWAYYPFDILPPKYDIELKGATAGISAFAWNDRIKEIAVTITLRDGDVASSLFNGSRNLHTVKKLVVQEGTKYPATFQFCDSLANLPIEGTIGQDGLNLSWSPLSKASLASVINALSATTTGLTVTLRLAAVNTAFETSTGAADGSTSEEWLALAATKPNWTINLINS